MKDGGILKFNSTFVRHARSMLMVLMIKRLHVIG
jgi:hypothetical protein